MKSKIGYFGFAMFTAVVLLACGGTNKEVPAQASGEKAYWVPPERNNSKNVPSGGNATGKEHDNAIYMFFRTSPPASDKWGIVFMQTQGTYSFDPFVCLNGSREPSSQSYSCSGESVKFGVQLKETVTVGRLPNSFCGALRGKHNPGPGPNPTHPIMEDSECPNGLGKCTCYEVVLECWNDASKQYDEGACPPDFAAVNSGRASDGTANAPPGHGAGSGRR